MVIRGRALMQEHKKTSSMVSVQGLRQELSSPLLDLQRVLQIEPKTQKICELWETN